MTLFVIVSLIVLVACLAPAVFYRFEAWGPSGGVTAAWAVAGLFAWASLTALYGWLAFGTEETIKLAVERTERIAEDGDGKWMIYAESGETFENTDAWFHGKTRSTDFQRFLVAGKTYTCRVNGFRSGVLSRYRNVLYCDGIKRP